MAIREITCGALFVALGLVTPILFHAVGLGSVFLPLFLPVLASGLCLRPLPAGLVGLLTPLLSSLLTGMPPMMPPFAFVMSVEGLVLGTVSAVLYRRAGWNIYMAAAVAVTAQRVIMATLTAFLAPWFGLPGPMAALVFLLYGLPGVFLLVVLVPAVMKRLQPFLEIYHGVSR